MSSTQPGTPVTSLTKTLKLENKVRLYQPSSKNGYRYNFDIPEQYITDYRKAISQFNGRYKFLAETFHQLYPNPPYRWEDFSSFMKEQMGIEVTIRCCEVPVFTNFAGTWEWEDAEKTGIIISINAAHPERKKKMTILHECIHALQDLDQEFKVKLDTYPIPIQLRIADRIAEKAAIEILMPEENRRMDRRYGLTPMQIAVKYDVSFEMASYN